MKKRAILFGGLLMSSLFFTTTIFGAEQSKKEMEMAFDKLGCSEKQIQILLDKEVPAHASFSKNIVMPRISSQQQAIVNAAKAQIGTPYYAGGNSPSTGFDCSGFVQYVIKTATGKDVGRTTFVQMNSGQTVNRNQLQPGDIIFFDNGYYNAIYIGNNQAITTLGTKAVGVAPVNELGSYFTARRVASTSGSTGGSTSGSTGGSTNPTTPSKPESNQALSNTYASVLKNNQTIYGNTSLTKVKGKTSTYYQDTLQLKRVYTIGGQKYYSAYDNKDNWLGYINQSALSTPNHSRGGAMYKKAQFVSVAKMDYKMWKDFDFKTVRQYTTDWQNMTLYSKGYYQHFNGQKYLSVYSGDEWLGYVNASAMKVENSGFGPYHSFNKYVSVAKDNYGLFKDKNFKNKVGTSKDVYKQTLFAKGYYDCADGTTYYSVYNAKDEWLGYLNSKAVSVANSSGGVMYKHKQWIRAAKADYPMWQNFSFKEERQNTTQWMDKPLYSKGYYIHFNGQKYLSVYYRDQWLGYINAKGMVPSNDPFENGRACNLSVMVTAKGYSVFKDKAMKNRVMKSDDIYDGVYHAKYMYDCADGATYYSLYDNDGTWLGYINGKALNV